MSKQNLYFGKTGEDVAVGFLKETGYKVLARNYKTKFGEIDIIALDRNTLCFVEVKTRHNDKFGIPFEAVSQSKQRKISKVALMYLKENKLLDKKARFDVVSIKYLTRGNPHPELVKNAFELDEKFVY